MSVTLTRAQFVSLVRSSSGRARTLAIPLGLRLLGDQLTPVLAYRRLVVGDPRTAPSFLFESVEGGDKVGRYSLMGSAPLIEVVSRGTQVRVTDRRAGVEVEEDPARSAGPPRTGPGGGATGDRGVVRTFEESDPLRLPQHLMESTALVVPDGPAGASLPGSLVGGWVGFASYDSVRYTEPEKLGWASAPHDDRGLPDIHLALYHRVVVFDHAATLVHAVQLAFVSEGQDPGAAYDEAVAGLRHTAWALQVHSKPLPSGMFEPVAVSGAVQPSNLTVQQHAHMVARAKEYIRAGDIFQVVLGQRFERRSSADPFDVYRALRAINPSPYMGYLQGDGCILVASSPEILCRVKRDSAGALVVTNRPLAGTRRRGADAAEDASLARDLLADQKERSEHIMLVDLGRNDVGRVAKAGSIKLPALMEVERYSHVMHISSTVTGTLADGLDCWDALRAALPVGTISGAPKVRAMQIIDELEPVRRGPYGGGFGYVSLAGEMDVALTLRTLVIPTDSFRDGQWTYHLQSSGGIVADSDPAAEYQETVNKAAAMARAIDVAERAFTAE